MQQLQYPTLKRASFDIDPATQTELSFKPSNRYLMLGIVAPEVPNDQVEALERSNMNTYEQGVKQFFSGSSIVYDESEIIQPGKRIITGLETLHGSIDVDGKYRLAILYLEF